jgi:nucleoside phosphorylase
MPGYRPEIIHYEIERKLWVRSQQMRILIRVNPDRHWELEGIATNSPEQGDEALDTLQQLLEQYQRYGIYQLSMIDSVLGWIEGKIGYHINVARERKGWRSAGVYDDSGKAIRTFHEDNLLPEAASPDAIPDTIAYDPTAQSWYPGKFPAFDEISKDTSRLLVQGVQVVLMTATSDELNAVLAKLVPLPAKQRLLKAAVGMQTYYIGKFGAYEVAVTMCQPGALKPGGAAFSADDAIEFWKPKAVIMTGIAFGASQRTQKIGDVLVATKIYAYEPQRVGTNQTIPRGDSPNSDLLLLNRFLNVPDWEFLRPDGKAVGLRFGPLLSGEKLSANLAFKARLLQTWPDAIGGEMEGAGLYAAAVRHRVPWIVVKAICDWGDGAKDDKHHALAAAASTSLVQHVLSQKYALDGL